MADHLTTPGDNVAPLVSVVTAFYNEQDFLEETIRSVLAQTYTHWELLLVDDGSPDNSRSIAQRFSREYPGKIIYLHHPGRENKGVCRSRNLGVSAAKGEFIAFLDADDVWLENKLANQVAIFRQHPEATTLLEASVYWYSWEDSSRRDVTLEVGSGQNRLYDPPQLMIQLYPLGNGAAPCPSGMMVRRKIHEHISFVEEFVGPTAVYEDQAFLAQIYLAEKVYVSSQANNLYRQRARSQVFNVHQDGRYHKVRQFYLDWLEKYLNDRNYTNREIRRLLWRARLPYRYPILFRLAVKMKKVLGRILKRRWLPG